MLALCDLDQLVPLFIAKMRHIDHGCRIIRQ